MKVGDLIKVKNDHWDSAGMIGIIIFDVANAGKGFKVLFSDGIIRPKMKSNLEVISEVGN
jgi:hypothetical protein